MSLFNINDPNVPAWRKFGFPDQASFDAIYGPGAIGPDANASQQAWVAANTTSAPPSGYYAPNVTDLSTPLDQLAPGAPSSIPASTSPPTPTTTTVGGLTADQANGKAILQAILRDSGLDDPSLAQYITDLITAGGTATDWQARLNADLYDTGSTLGKIVNQRFPELGQRIKNGYAPMSVGEALSYRTTAAQYARAEGLPPDLLDPAKLIANNVALPEVQSRLHGFYREFSAQAPDVAEQLHTLYNLSPAQIGALAVNPDVTEQHLVNMLQAGQIGAAGVRTGFGQIGAGTAEGLAAQGVTADQAQAGFGQLARNTPLFTALPGSGEDTISQGEQLGAQFSNAQAAQLRIERRRQQRLAAFQGGGGLGASNRGVGGLGSASNQ